MHSEFHAEFNILWSNKYEKAVKKFIIECIVLRMTGKYPFILGRLPTGLNHIPLL